MIDVIRAGLLTSIQDPGRHGYRHLGIATGGALDALALEVGNRLVGNRPEAATIEVTVVFPCMPAMAIPYFSRMSSASISVRWITGIFSRWASAIWSSWKAQMEGAATVGFMAIGLDMRAYGGSSAPVEAEAYFRLAEPAQ